MFWIPCYPSSGSTEPYLTEVTHYGSQTSCARSVFGSVIFEPVVCVYCAMGLRTTSSTSSQPILKYTRTTGSKITLPNTYLAHDKFL